MSQSNDFANYYLSLMVYSTSKTELYKIKFIDRCEQKRSFM